MLNNIPGLKTGRNPAVFNNIYSEPFYSKFFVLHNLNSFVKTVYKTG